MMMIVRVVIKLIETRSSVLPPKVKACTLGRSESLRKKEAIDKKALNYGLNCRPGSTASVLHGHF